MKQVTREEARQLFIEIGHMATVYIYQPECDQDGYKIGTNRVAILNESTCYDKKGAQLGGSSNEANAEKTIEQIDREFEVYSSYFYGVSGRYEITY